MNKERNECNYCHKEFLSKGNLTTHKRTSKACGKIQESFDEMILLLPTCKHCNKQFSKLDRHVCKEKLKQKNEELMSFNEELEELNAQLKNVNAQLKNVNQVLEGGPS